MVANTKYFGVTHVFLDFGADLRFVILKEFGTGRQEAGPFHSPVFSRL